MTQFSPDAICTRLTPGVAQQHTVMLTNLPEDGSLSVQVDGVGSLVRVSETVVSEMHRRPMTSREIAELPSNPPQVREDARRYGFVEETHVVFVAPGSSSVPVAPGQEADVCEAPPDTPEAWYEGRLAVYLGGPNIAEVPLHVAVGATHTRPELSAEAVTVVLEPGEERRGAVWIAEAPSKADVRDGSPSTSLSTRSSRTLP